MRFSLPKTPSRVFFKLACNRLKSFTKSPPPGALYLFYIILSEMLNAECRKRVYLGEENRTHKYFTIKPYTLIPYSLYLIPFPTFLIP
jgi:hypothetical protein